MMDLQTELGIHERDAEIERLRAIIKTYEDGDAAYKDTVSYFANTRDGIIEECACLTELWMKREDGTLSRSDTLVIAAIRALKDKP